MIDVNKVDVRLETWGPWQGRIRQIGLQLKATSSPSFVGPSHDRKLAYSLDAADYNSLLEDCSYQRFLVVVALPPIEEAWVRQRPSMVGLGAAAWWCQVSGDPTAQGSATVHLPIHQRFDSDALNSMMELA